jgi:site-specific recombinase XerD
VKQKLWQKRVGPHGAAVLLAERRYGGSVYLFWGRRKRSLGFRVRDPYEKRIKERVKRAEQAGLEFSAQLVRGETADNVTLRCLVDLYRREAIPEQGRRRREDSEREIECWLNWLGATFVMDDLGPAEWNRFRRERETGRIDARGKRVARNHRPVGARAVAKSLKTLRHMCRVAVQHGLLRADPTAGLECPTNKSPKRPICDDDRYEALLSIADQVTMYGPWRKKVKSYLPALLVLAHDTGHRITAILNLRWSDWLPDFRTHGGLHWRAETDKIGLDDVVPVTPEVRAAVECHRSEYPGVGEALMFPKPKDPSQPVDHRTATRWLVEAEKKAELPKLEGGAWHPFRRGWATARKGQELKDVARAGGWKDVTTLLKLYQQADLETTEKVVLHARRLRLA